MASRFALAFPLGVTIGKWTRAFAERQPGVELVVTPSADPLAALAAGEADMVFARDAAADDDRHLIPLYSEDIVVVMHHEHLLTLEEKLHLADLDGEPRVTGEPSEALMRSVAEGDGIALLPASVAKALRRKDVTAMRLEDGAVSQVGLSWPRDGQHPLVDEFIRHANACCSFCARISGTLPLGRPPIFCGLFSSLSRRGICFCSASIS